MSVYKSIPTRVSSDALNRSVEMDDIEVTRVPFYKNSGFWKMIFSFSLLIPVYALTAIGLNISNARRPTTSPLPDMIHENVEYMNIEKIIDNTMTILIAAEILFIAFDKRRYTIYRRTISVYGILCFLRVFTMTCTSLPDPSPRCPSTIDTNVSYSIIGMIKTLVGVTCGDMIFSGHTMGFLFPALVHNWYFGKKIGALFTIFAFIGPAAIVTSRLHYTVDVLLSAILTPLLFVSYNVISENPTVSKSLPKLLSKYFRFMEWSELEINQGDIGNSDQYAI